MSPLGFPKGLHELMLGVKTTIGVNMWLSHSRLDLTIATSSKKPYEHGVADDSIRPPTGDLLRRARALALDMEGRR